MDCHFKAILAQLYEVKIQQSASYVPRYPTKSLCLESHNFVGEAKAALKLPPQMHKVFGGNPMTALCACMESCRA